MSDLSKNRNLRWLGPDLRDVAELKLAAAEQNYQFTNRYIRAALAFSKLVATRLPESVTTPDQWVRFLGSLTVDQALVQDALTVHQSLGIVRSGCTGEDAKVALLHAGVVMGESLLGEGYEAEAIARHFPQLAGYFEDEPKGTIH